jgi:hypothetical protein
VGSTIGPHDPQEVCVYPDTGKVMVHGLRSVGYLERSGGKRSRERQPG